MNALEKLGLLAIMLAFSVIDTNVPNAVLYGISFVGFVFFMFGGKLTEREAK